MVAWNANALFEGVDRIYRRAAAHREGAIVREVPGGWLRYKPGMPAGEFASTGETRLMWASPDRVLDDDAVEGAAAALKSAGCERAFVWLSPLAWTEGLEAALARAGASRVPYVNYFLLAREAGVCLPARPSKLTTRMLAPDEAGGVLDAIAPWYSHDGAAAAKRQIAAGMLELHAAFDGDRPVAAGGLITLGTWAYLGWAGTDPAFRGQGAQSSLIAARVSRAAALGLKWCVSETNTVVRTSLDNLARAGFEPAAEWCVYRWDVLSR